MMLIDLVIATRDRRDQLEATLASVWLQKRLPRRVIVVDNGSKDDTWTWLAEESKRRNCLSAIRLMSNVGAGPGKNVGLRESDADAVVVLDDDAQLLGSDVVSQVERCFERNPRVAVIQFKIVDGHTNRVRGYEFPGDHPEVMKDVEHEIGYFIGAGHAIRRRALIDVGFYSEILGLYGHEEIELAYRLIRVGWALRYCPCVEVVHMKDPRGRLSGSETVRRLFYNRLVLNWQYLPARYAIVSSLLWAIKLGRECGGKAVYEELGRFLRRRSDYSRDPVGRLTVDRIKAVGGRLYR